MVGHDFVKLSTSTDFRYNQFTWKLLDSDPKNIDNNHTLIGKINKLNIRRNRVKIPWRTKNNLKRKVTEFLFQLRLYHMTILNYWRQTSLHWTFERYGRINNNSVIVFLLHIFYPPGRSCSLDRELNIGRFFLYDFVYGELVTLFVE